MAYPLRFPQDKPLVTVTRPSNGIWVIEMHNGADSRLSIPFIDGAMKPALDAIEADWRNSWRASAARKDKSGGKGAVIIVGNRSQDKFFSNGLDLEGLTKDPLYSLYFFPQVFNPFVRRLLSFPLLTIAAINGHCFAGGMMLALLCDYRVMTDGSQRNAWMCMNEIHLGLGYPHSFASLIRAKFPDVRVHRKIILEGHRFTASEALQAGLIDYAASGNTEAVIAKAQEVAGSLNSLAASGTWGVTRAELYHDVIEASLKNTVTGSAAVEDAYARAKL
ncbi:ClpP/crotonase [Panus rudis PR-1116 ss-1]|nr:ClpP/crotonase [Panus rudis PR-1116 ss-1]